MAKDDTMILLVDDTDSEQAIADIVAYVDQGVVNPTAKAERLDDYMARGRHPQCTCQLITCECTLAAQHKPDCDFRIALLCPIGIRCEPHKLEVCPTCDPCTC